LKLTIIERLSLLDLLPKEGSFVTLKLVRKLRETLSFTEKEIDIISFMNGWQCPKCKNTKFSSTKPLCDDCKIGMLPIGQVTWDESKEATILKDIHIGKSMRELCVFALKDLSEQGKLKENHMSLYIKFVKTEEKDEEE